MLTERLLYSDMDHLRGKGNCNKFNNTHGVAKCSSS